MSVCISRMQVYLFIAGLEYKFQDETLLLNIKYTGNYYAMGNKFQPLTKYSNIVSINLLVLYLSIYQFINSSYMIISTFICICLYPFTLSIKRLPLYLSIIIIIG